MVTVSELAETPIIKQKFHFWPLRQINRLAADQEPRYRRGNICTARPAGDTIGPLTAYGAEVQLVLGKESRWEPISKFITGPGKTNRKDGEC